MAKKSVDKMTKAELLREVKRLQKQVDKLQAPKVGTITPSATSWRTRPPRS